LEDKFPEEILQYFGKDEICMKNRHTFFKPRKTKFITNDSANDYDLDLERLIQMIKNKGGTFQYQHKVHKFRYDSRMITEKILYGEEEGLLIASKFSLRLLSRQTAFSMDATFNITKYKNLKLITVVFLDGNRKIVLGCVGLLPGGESAGNITSFIRSMKRAAKKVSDNPFANLKYIVTDDSQASHNSL
ncbi:hypothetical protein C6P40_004960, partial [Pichia californica]